MKLLIAVKSCKRDADAGAHDIIRQTWGHESYLDKMADLCFFMGEGNVETRFDEIVLPAPDHYKGLSQKVNSILDWAIQREYDGIVLADTDTFLVTPRLYGLPWGQFDYAGMLLPWSGPFMFGGPGFAMSRNAAQIVLNNPIQDDMDDISIGRILLRRPQPDITVLPVQWHRRIGWHFPKNTYVYPTYRPNFPWMDMMAQKYLPGYFHGQRQHFWNTVIGGAQRTVALELLGEDRSEV